MVSPGQIPAYSDLQALATLANTKIAPTTPYSFPAFAGTDAIGIPPGLKGTASYVSTGSYPDGTALVVWIWPYKTIAGTKTYSWQPLTGTFSGVVGSGPFNVTWNWTPPATLPADGYIAVVVNQTLLEGAYYIWKDIGGVSALTLNDPNYTGWLWDFTLSPYQSSSPVFPFTQPVGDLPCGHGIWLKTLNMIHHDLFTGMDLFGGSKFTFSSSLLTSGPWCVSVAPKCYLTLNSKDVFSALQFIYSPADSATGNSLSSEADLFTYVNTSTPQGVFFPFQNGANSFDFTADGTLNGQIIVYSAGVDDPSLWTLSASDPSVVITRGFAIWADSTTHTAFAFTFVATPYAIGTPIVLTATPPAGQSVAGGGAGGFYSGGDIAVSGTSPEPLVFTVTPTTMTQTDFVAIHYSGSACKSVALANTLPAVTVTSSAGANNTFPSHWRSFCNGVFIANTLPTFGINTYVDVDLPQYNPKAPVFGPPASSRRALLSNDPTQISIPVVPNKGALWPVFRDTDFTPDSYFGQPVTGSVAWRGSIFTKAVTGSTFPDTVPPITSNLYVSQFPLEIIPAGTGFPQTLNLKLIINNPGLSLIVRLNNPPTVSTFDASAPPQTWLDCASSIPGFSAGGQLFVGLYNNTVETFTNVTTAVEFDNLTAPNGTFFPTQTDGVNTFPALEGYSYQLNDATAIASAGLNAPIPLFGYCIFSVTCTRVPVDNGHGVTITPTSGTSDLDVSLGLMTGFGFNAAGTFQPIQTVTIPAGQGSVTTAVFWPVLSGTPLAYQSAQQVIVGAEVNFQPMAHSSFNPSTGILNGNPVPTGVYCGPLWFDAGKASLFYNGGFITLPFVLQIAAVLVNDLTNTLNLL